MDLCISLVLSSVRLLMFSLLVLTGVSPGALLPGRAIGDNGTDGVKLSLQRLVGENNSQDRGHDLDEAYQQTGF